MSYRRDDVKAPRLSGLALRAFVSTIEGPFGGPLLQKLLRDSGIEAFRSQSAGSAPSSAPALPHPAPPAPQELVSREALAQRASAASKGTSLETVAAFGKAYASGATSPVQVIARLHEAIARLDGGPERLGFFIARKPDEVQREAAASAARLARGAARSVFEGVPVAVKDEVDLAGFPTTLGTRFLNEVRTADSTVAARLKAAGALILGKTNMNEIGINPLSVNPHHGTARNPYDRTRTTGGSSSGSAGVVSAGLCPVAIGADGGGSIRIPAGLCGVVGLKATYGRIPETGVPPLCGTVGHLGPIGLTVADVAAAYAILAGPDGHDALARLQPPAHLAGHEETSLAGLRLGVCEAYFSDAAPDVVARCQAALAALVERGATVVELPPPNLNTILWSHSALILSEMQESMYAHGADFTRFALSTRTNLALGRAFASTDLVHALRHRHQLILEQLELMQQVDLVVTPTTAITAPELPEKALPEGDTNLPVVDQLMRFVRLANLTGFPALAVPAGYDAGGLPVSLQLTARPWEEHLLFRAGRVVEASVEHRVPGIHVEVLR
jgi:Asp-tRNA(Asn)/Glu-tRNA(Gln) amidotransferase A subunit family amidase